MEHPSTRLEHERTVGINRPAVRYMCVACGGHKLVSGAAAGVCHLCGQFELVRISGPGLGAPGR